tara:strand:+ start:874 stop:1281 length:408 start_codon:yes stop_codon:yes gene_type:complete
MYKFSYQNKLFNLYIFKFFEDVTDEDTVKYNKDILNLINMKENIFIVYDISEINNWYPLNTYIKNAKKLFSSTKLIKGNMKACSIIVNSNYINTLKFVLKIINAFGICDYYITDKLDDAFLHLNKQSTNLHINSN